VSILVAVGSLVLDRQARPAHAWIRNLYAILIGKSPCFGEEPRVMTPSPATPSEYRVPAIPQAEASDGSAFCERPHPVFAIVWLASLARVVGAIHGHEIFGAEATLALMTLAALTCWTVATATAALRRR
jgi:hypothetical protein